MPAQPVWFQRIDRILRELQTLAGDYLDRKAVERLFGVRQRRARQLMAGLPCIRIGNAAAVPRLALLARVEAIADGEAFQYESSRRVRVTERLENIRRQAVARRVKLPVAPDALSLRTVELTPEITVSQGEMRIRFEGAEDLAARLFELAQTMANDWQGFRQRVEEGRR